MNCHACIGACPIKHCNDGSGDYVAVDHNTCIGCGQCLDACHHGARKPVDDADRFFADLDKGVSMVAIVAPAVAAVFPDEWLRLNGWLTSLGVKAVFDVSFGAELTVKSYLDHLEKNQPKAIIAQPCPAIVSYIELYRPELIPHLAPADSPMLHTAKMVTRFYPQYREHRIVVLSPCAAKRREFDETGIGDYNLTFLSVIAHLKAKGQRLSEFPARDYDNPPAERAVLFSSPGGLLETARRWNPGVDALSRKIEGPHTVYRYLNNLPAAIRDGSQDHIESAVRRRATAMREHYRQEMKAVSPEKLQKEVVKGVDKLWEPGLYGRTYVDRSTNVAWKTPGDAELAELFKTLLKRSKQDELDCGGCGYGTCREMAKAIHNKLSRREHCHLYKRRRIEEVAADAGELHRVSSSAQELGAAVEQLSSAIKEVERHAIEALSQAEQGASAANQVLEAVTALSTAGDAITRFSGTVEQIASQTRLLALNATIEAARAGDLGKGFGVVATEVKELANASGKAAAEISQQVKAIQIASGKASELVQRLSGTSESIRASQSSIAAAVGEQANAVRVMSEKINAIARETEDRAEKVARSLAGRN